MKAEALAERIGYAFQDPELLRRALTHASARRTQARDNNERMEFLGDRVLGLIIAEMLFAQYPGEAEGKLARRLNAMVRLETCADVGREVGLSDAIRTAPNEPQALTQNTTVLGDACEALIAALYLDGGLPAARAFIHRYWQARLAQDTSGERDPKTALQEWALGLGIGVPDYVEISRSGPDHDPAFVIEVRVGPHAPQTAQGRSKREASRMAAEAFLKREKIWP